ncbi:uncharacterized protein EI90DRAFT_3160783 [Cantharellus anzutake]|uniref:uncharacterized protein n=1 Tax=Cantharellus anzutake TaxID=1750568 RepID=UPI00190699ED|nr:uncharacterized protein EI90DRAFT_3160783 [Cantharellus anzutake]KAF8311031.1 hypothetical protein EI90DRAFT_3160783 [Cantharellus anzutake]
MSRMAPWKAAEPDKIQQFTPPLDNMPVTSQNVPAVPIVPQRSRLRPDGTRIGELQHRDPLAVATHLRRRSDAGNYPSMLSGLVLYSDTYGGGVRLAGPSHIDAPSASDLIASAKSPSSEMPDAKAFYIPHPSAELQRRPHIRRKCRGKSSSISSLPAHDQYQSDSVAPLPQSAPAASSSYSERHPPSLTSRTDSPTSSFSSSKSSKPYLHPIITRGLPTQPKSNEHVEWPAKKPRHPAFLFPLPTQTGSADVSGSTIKTLAKVSTSTSTLGIALEPVLVSPPPLHPTLERPKAVKVVGQAQSGPTTKRSKKVIVESTNSKDAAASLSIRPSSSRPPVSVSGPGTSSSKGKEAVRPFQRPFRPLPKPPSNPAPVRSPEATIAPISDRKSPTLRALLDPPFTLPSRTIFTQAPPNSPANSSKILHTSDSTPSLTRSASLDSISIWSQASGPATGAPPTRVSSLAYPISGPRQRMSRRSTNRSMRAFIVPPLAGGQKEQRISILYQSTQEELDTLTDWLRYDSLLEGSNTITGIAPLDNSLSLETKYEKGGGNEPIPSGGSHWGLVTEDKKQKTKLRRADTNAVKEMLLQRRERAQLDAQSRAQDIPKRFAGMGFGSQLGRRPSHAQDRSANNVNRGPPNGKGMEMGRMIAVM